MGSDANDFITNSLIEGEFFAVSDKAVRKYKNAGGASTNRLDVLPLSAWKYQRPSRNCHLGFYVKRKSFQVLHRNFASKKTTKGEKSACILDTMAAI